MTQPRTLERILSLRVQEDSTIYDLKVDQFNWIPWRGLSKWYTELGADLAKQAPKKKF